MAEGRTGSPGKRWGACLAVGLFFAALNTAFTNLWALSTVRAKVVSTGERSAARMSRSDRTRAVSPDASVHRVRADLNRVWPMETLTLGDFEGIGRGSLRRRAHFAQAAWSDARTASSMLRDAERALCANGPGDEKDCEPKLRSPDSLHGELRGLSTLNRDIANVALVLYDLARIGETLEKSGLPLLAQGSADPRTVRNLERLAEDAARQHDALRIVRSTALARAEGTDVRIALTGIGDLRDGRLTPGRLVTLAAEARRSTLRMGDAIDPFRHLMRESLRRTLQKATALAGRARTEGDPA